MRSLTVALFVCMATAVPAQAQIYSWRDASGKLVISDQPRAGNAAGMTYEVPGSAILRTAGKPPSSDRPMAYDDLIRQHANRNGVSPDLVRAVIQAESGFNPYAVSRKGAMGLMQLMPATARAFGVRNPFHPGENIRAGVAYLAQLLTRFNQDVQLALAAYNAGPEKVERYDGIPPYRETQAYVRKITGTTKAAARPEPVIYRWMELVDGQPKLRYSNIPPSDTAYEIVGKR